MKSPDTLVSSSAPSGEGMPEDLTQLVDGMLGAYALAAKTTGHKKADYILEYDRKRVELQLRFARLTREKDDWKLLAEKYRELATVSTPPGATT